MTGKEKSFIKRYIEIFPIYGCISTGIIYTSIGIIAILSFLKIKDGGADESSLLAFLDDYILGKIFIWIILLGTVSYIIWRIYESIRDPYDYGSDARGIGKRIGIALSSIADALIAFAAIQVLLGSDNFREDGNPVDQRQMVGDILMKDWGEWAIMSLGVIICLTAIVQFFYGVTKGYRERLEIGDFSEGKKKVIHLLAWVGYLARGIIIGITGFFFIKAGIVENEQFVVNTDKAFDFIGDHVGHLWFILVAIGTIFYGLFMFAMGATYHIDKH